MLAAVMPDYDAGCIPPTSCIWLSTMKLH